MTYDEFVEEFCEGMAPTKGQAAAIEAFLENPLSQQVWIGGHGSGKTVLARWLINAQGEPPRRPAHMSETEEIAQVDSRAESQCIGTGLYSDLPGEVSLVQKADTPCRNKVSVELTFRFSVSLFATESLTVPACPLHLDRAFAIGKQWREANRTGA